MDDQFDLKIQYGILETAVVDWVASSEAVGIVSYIAALSRWGAYIRVREPVSSYIRDCGNADSTYSMLDVWSAQQAFRVVKKMLVEGLVRIGDGTPFKEWNGDVEQHLSRIDTIIDELPEGAEHLSWFYLDITPRGFQCYLRHFVRVAAKIIVRQGAHRALSIWDVEFAVRNVIGEYTEEEEARVEGLDEGIIYKQIFNNMRLDENSVQAAVSRANDGWWLKNRVETVSRVIECLNFMSLERLLELSIQGNRIDVIDAAEVRSNSEAVQWLEEMGRHLSIVVSDKGKNLSEIFKIEPNEVFYSYMFSEYKSELK
ncbi:hypothetical protein [Natronoglycomyces albus]|uniref:Uncharacterized protein n=1 Tax=Natronoglycomyces albus TaxID=2811108 RepID=A0A895XUY8_9ACTN|nr:hypothetical protein [Natronoglycomyces albus]QSB06040.1 hypothetical protein JQS30_03705 [Natronoglycomyces albus]